MNSKDYWEKRVARQMYNQMQTAEEYAKDLAKYYKRASRQLSMDSQNILSRFALKNHISKAEAERILKNMKDPADIKELLKELAKDPKNKDIIKELEAQAVRARILKLDALHASVVATVGAIQIQLNKKAQKLFIKLAKDAYYHAIFDAQQKTGFGFKVKMLNAERIKGIMDKSWSGSGFSQRIWQNIQDLEKAVKREIMVTLLTGRSLFEASKAINEEFAKGLNNARRLIRTESSYVTNQMKLMAYKELGVEKYIYVAILDLKTSKICRSLDKKRFLVKNAKVGTNYPPMHPWCRSTTIEWVPDSVLKRMKQRAYDPKTGRLILVPADMTYDEWYKRFVQGVTPRQDNTEQNLTRAQYDRYKARLGDEFDLSYDEFIKMKSDRSEWSKWQRKYREAKNKQE